MSTERDAVLQQVSGVCRGTPYTVTPTAEGFDLHLDLVDRQWWSLLGQHRLTRAFVHHVRLDEANHRFTIEDVQRSIAWDAGFGGTPRWSGSTSVMRGRQIAIGGQKVWSVTPHGVEKIADYSFDTREAHGLVRAVLAPAGWSERLPGSARAGLVVGLGTLGLLAVGGLVVLGLWLTGNLT